MYGDGSPILSDGSQILAGCPTTQLNSDTIYLELALCCLGAKSCLTLSLYLSKNKFLLFISHPGYGIFIIAAQSN